MEPSVNLDGVNYDTHYVIQIIENALQAPLFRISIAPPLALTETDDGPSLGHFCFGFKEV